MQHFVFEFEKVFLNRLLVHYMSGIHAGGGV